METVGWQLWDRRADRPGRWSRTHYTQDRGETTLCGQIFPHGKTCDSGPGDPGDVCRKCRSIKWRKFPTDFQD